MKLRSTSLALAVVLSLTSTSVVWGQATQENDTTKTTKSRKKKAKESSADTSTTPAAPAAEPATSSKASSNSAAAPANSAGVSATDISKAQSSGMVWVNTESGVYHKSGRYYGKTKQGKFMSEADAKKAGYRESKQEVGSKKS